MPRLNVEKLKEKLRKLLKEKIMVNRIENSPPKKYTVADVYTEAAKLMRSEMEEMKQRPLNSGEEIKMNALAKLLSKTVLKEMDVI